MKDVKNAVTLARRVMELSEHLLLAGPGASAFARRVGVPACDNGLLVTEQQRARFEQLKAGPNGSAGELPAGHGTVGAVARDVRGHLAAATSTGGRAMKLPGRVGDTAIVGCGTYADDCAHVGRPCVSTPNTVAAGYNAKLVVVECSPMTRKA